MRQTETDKTADKRLRLVFATGNKDKLREIREILSGEISGLEVLSMKEAGVDTDIEENGTTFEENALIKARAVAEELAKLPDTDGGSEDVVTVVCADDSGLSIDALDGAPGVLSARFMGYDTPYTEKNALILEKLKDVKEEDRGARFICAVAAVFIGKASAETEKVFRGVMEGRIAWSTAGNGGFGYDPIFFLPEYGKTSAEITEEEKNSISHRGKAIRALAQYLTDSQQR